MIRKGRNPMITEARRGLRIRDSTTAKDILTIVSIRVPSCTPVAWRVSELEH